LPQNVIVVTGASNGIGLATAYAFAERGDAVVLAARRTQALEEAAAECRSRGGDSIAVRTDVTRLEDVQALAQRALDAFGRIDVWVNNAAVTAFGRIEDVPVEVFRRVHETNVFGYMHGIRAVLPCFRAQGRGVLINVASAVSFVPQPFTAAYVSSKFAIRALSECARMELILDGVEDIHVCTVLPASIDTPLFDSGANYSGRAIQAMTPVYPPEMVAATIVDVADRPRPTVYAGRAGQLAAMVHEVLHPLVPRVMERMGADQVDRDHFQDEPAPTSDGNLFQPSGAHAELTGGWRQGPESGPGAKGAGGLIGAALLAGAVGYVAWRWRREKPWLRPA
jgi:NAD(P)-dependent dehydrogenase (short-subunit alcohol dehydrogenase family)